MKFKKKYTSLPVIWTKKLLIEYEDCEIICVLVKSRVF